MCSVNKCPVSNCECRSRSLRDLTRYLCRTFLAKLFANSCEQKGYTARAAGGHAASLGVSGKIFSLAFILPSPLVRFPVLN